MGVMNQELYIIFQMDVIVLAKILQSFLHQEIDTEHPEM